MNIVLDTYRDGVGRKMKLNPLAKRKLSSFELDEFMMGG